MTVVVDASLAFKWIAVEDKSDKARAFYARHFDGMHAPDFLLIEVAGSLVRQANERKISVADAREGVSEFRLRVDQAVKLRSVTTELIGAAADLAMSLGHPLKDCIYLALADQLGCPLATADVKFRNRVGDPARVRLLAELV